MKKYTKYIIPSFITFIILGIIYYYNGLYPFGKNPLVQVDADYLYIPVLYKIWDLLHGYGNLLYTDLGLGNSLYASLIIQGSLFSPLNLLLYLVDRSNIVNFFGLFMIIKICLISLTSYIYIDKTYKINYFYKVLFSILYTFNGFIILNYFNEIWLDIVILFPLLTLYLNKLLMDNKNTGYIIVLAMCFIITFYYSYFIIIFILLYSFIYLNLYKKEEAKEIIFKLGISTLIAFLISCFSSLPLIYQILNSARFNFDTYTEIFSNIGMKSLYLLFSPLFIIIFIKLMTKYKSNKKSIYGYFILAFLYIIPVFIDPVNALIHGGSYWNFPYRYGFVTSFILMDGCLYYISRYLKKDNNRISVKDIVISITIIILGVLGRNINYLYRRDIINKGILLEIDNKMYLYIIYMVIIVYLMYILMLFIKNKWVKYCFVGLISLYSIFLFTSWTIYYNSGYYLSKNAMDVYKNININKGGRYKVEYNNYTPDYGFMFDVATLDNWLHILPQSQIDVYKNMGYYTSGTSIYSYGGTIFTDYLLNFRYLFSKDDMVDNDIYSMADNYNDKYLYKYNYSNNYGIVFDKIDDILFDNKFVYQNELYKNLYDKDDNIINYDEYEIIDSKENVLEYNIEEDSFVYFYTNYYNNIDHICILDNCIYNFDDYIKYLGYYNEKINIRVYLKENIYFNYYIGYIRIDDIINLATSQVKYIDNKYYINVDKSKYLFLPINNISGIHVYNNGKETSVYNYLNNFICIKLNKGDNVIDIKYELPLFKLGLLLSFVGLILLFLQKKFILNNLILNISYILYIVLVIGMFLYYYFYSLFKYLI